MTHSSLSVHSCPTPPSTLGEFTLLSPLGFGSFGQIFLARTASSIPVALKVEHSSLQSPQLKFESRLYQLLGRGGPIGVPKFYGYFEEGEWRAMALEQLGPNLETLFEQCGRRWSLFTICHIAIEALNRLEFLHSHSFLHRDIKPDNFLISSQPSDGTIHLIDFGLAKKYRDMKTFVHIPYNENKELSGTARYASCNAHIGIESARRDDMESLAYVLLYFALGSLPWQGLRRAQAPAVTSTPAVAAAPITVTALSAQAKVVHNANKTDALHQVALTKLNTSVEDLCRDLPLEFRDFLLYTRSLSFDAKPDYEKWRICFTNILKANGTEIRDPLQLDWHKRERGEPIVALIPLAFSPSNNRSSSKEAGGELSTTPFGKRGERTLDRDRLLPIVEVDTAPAIFPLPSPMLTATTTAPLLYSKTTLSHSAQVEPPSHHSPGNTNSIAQDTAFSRSRHWNSVPAHSHSLNPGGLYGHVNKTSQSHYKRQQPQQHYLQSQQQLLQHHHLEQQQHEHRIPYESHR